MYKKFVPLNCSKSPSKNPYEVRTFLGEPLKSQHPEWRTENCGYDRDCDAPQNSKMSQVLTLEDEIRKIHRRTQENIFTEHCRTKCKEEDRHLKCVVPQRTPQDLKRHAVLREKYIKVKHDIGDYVHDMGDIYMDHPSLIKLNSPPAGSEDEGDDRENEEIYADDIDVKPEIASPECSMEMIYIPTARILEVQRPKSGVYLNESPVPNFKPNDEIPYSTYNPRLLQEEFDRQYLKKIDVIPGKTAQDLWTWNMGLQQRESELDRRFIEAAVPKFDCDNIELTVYKIPTDLDKTFTASIVFGTKTIKLEPEARRKVNCNRPKEMACLYIAYVEGFRLNADFWTAETMDNIIKMGEKHTMKSHKMNYKGQNNDYDIIPQIAERQAEVGLKVHFTGPLKSEPNIYKALSLYFSKYNACVLCSKRLYLLIWKRCKNFYYIYDPNGRSENCERDFEKGKSALMSTHFVEHLVHLIVNISQTSLDEEFNMYEIYLASFGKLNDSIPKKPFPKRFHKMWSVINDAYAVIPGCNNGLFQPNSALIPNPSMLISIMAILYAHIERGNEWKIDTIDELIRLGTAYYKSLRRKFKLKDNQHVNIADLPDKYVMGTYKASLKKAPFFYTGTVTDYCKKFLDSLLACGFNELFNSHWEAALLQIDNSVLGIWRDSELFYVYDPFRRGRAGQVLDPDDYMSRGSAVLQMHSNFESFLRILYQNALKMRRGGKFFIHAIRVGCIKPIMDGKPRKLRYPKLKLTPETYVSPKVQADEERGGGDKPDADAAEDTEEDEKNKSKASKKNKAGDKKDKKKLEKVCSIESLNEEERIAAFDNTDVVEGVVDVLITDIIGTFPEPTVARPKLYKSATQVLLRSDKDYLKQLKYMVNHDQDYDNVQAALPTEPEVEKQQPTLEEELAIPSNYQNLPDGTWILFASQSLPRLVDEQTKLKGLLSAIVTATLTARFKISTWTSALIEYATDASDSFGEEFQAYQSVLGALTAKKIPTLSLGKRTYNIRILKMIKSDAQKPIRQVLLECLVDHNRLLVVCQRFSCLIVKRYNFLYMFIGFPVNSVGYRKCTSGPACVLRFIEMDSLIRRIEFGCNPQGCDITKYIVFPLKIVDMTPDAVGRYRPWPAKTEKRMYRMALEDQRRQRESKKAKLQFLATELHKETERISEFEEFKKDHKKSKKPVRQAAGSTSNASDAEGPATMVEDADADADTDDDESGGFVKEEEDGRPPQLKHRIGTKIPKSRDACLRPRPILYGYRMREKDNLYKIQGSKSLDGRERVLDEIKPCFFASALAILYAILKPHNQWTSQRIDQVIDSSLLLSDTIEDMSTAYERTVKNVCVDDYSFNILIRTLDIIGLIGDLVKQLERVTTLRKYLILHTSNCAYAIYRDEYYHLFDAYPSMQLLDNLPEGGEEEDEELQRKQKMYAKGIKRYGERNTASWILFADAKSMVHYMDQRGSSRTWKEDEEYSFLVVDIISYKKSPHSAYVLQLLSGMDRCNIPGEEEASVCAHNETTAWLEHCLPIWSRLNRRNTAGLYRGMGVSKCKKYDIEIEHRLWSLWGNLHPQAPVFAESARGKQYLACCVMALCAARLYRLGDWSPQLMDSIIVNGDRYHQESIEDIKIPDYEMMVEELGVECHLDNVQFTVHIEPVCYGKLYCRPYFNRMNMAEAVMYFFQNYQFGLLQCFKKCLAFGYVPGHDGGYFMFDCQSRDHPLFSKGQGAAYMLRTKYLQILLYCMVVTLNIPYYNVQFTLHKVDMSSANASLEGEDADSSRKSR